MMKVLNEKAFSLVEIIIVISLSTVVFTLTMFALYNFRNNVVYDVVLNEVTESVNYVKLKSMTALLDSNNLQSDYSVVFFSDRFVEFEGDTYVEGASANVEHDVPVGISLSTNCSPVDNGTVTYSVILGTNNNSCAVSIYRIEQAYPVGNVIIGKYGIEYSY